MKFTFILPTRGKFEDLVKSVYSFINSAKNRENVDFLIVIDIDDEDRSKIESVFKDDNVKVLVTLRSNNWCNDYVNWACYKSTGDIVGIITDDVEMETYHWDQIIIDKIKDREHFLIDCFDSTHEDEDASFPRFPMISRKSIETIGFFFYPQVRMWPADKIIFNLYNACELVVECHDVKLTHYHLPNNDISKTRFWNIFQEDIANGTLPVNIAREKWLLNNAIKK